MRPGNSRVGLEVIDFVFLEQVKHALGQFLSGGPRPRDHFFEIETNLADLDAVLLRSPANSVHRAGRVEQRLGRNTPPIQANTPSPVPLDDRDTHLKLRSPNSSNITARPGSDHNKVIPRISQDKIPQRFSPLFSESKHRVRGGYCRQRCKVKSSTWKADPGWRRGLDRRVVRNQRRTPERPSRFFATAVFAQNDT